MVRKSVPRWSFLVSLALFAVPAAARADAIDGNWCFKGRHLAIEGPSILTPGGKSMKGNYSRHAFMYEAPTGEIEAGKQVFMILLDEETMEFHPGSESAPGQVWRRCTAPSS